MKRASLCTMTIALFSALSLGQVGAAEPKEKPATAEKGAQLKQPSTPEEHLAAAKGYRDQAAKERRVAELHRYMIQKRRETPGQLAPSDWYYEHCQKLVNAAEDLATTASELADYHEKAAQDLRKKTAR